MQIKVGEFPALEEMMQKYLFDGAADSFEEAVGFYKGNGIEIVRILISEIDKLISGPFDEADVAAFVTANSDYLFDDSGRATILYIKSLLV